MNLTVIYGTMDKTNTYDCVQLLLNYLRLNINIQTKEFFLGEDYFYYEYASHYHHFMRKSNVTSDINIIVKSIIKSDLIIFASPVSACDISTEMKKLLNNLSLCIVNNSAYPLSNKIGIAMSTAAGAGLFTTVRTLKKNLNFLGIYNTFKFSKSLYETNWECINSRLKKQIRKKILKLSFKIIDTYKNLHAARSTTLIKPEFSKTKPVLKNSAYNIINFNSFKRTKYYNTKHI